jgi:hypothetical protein
MSSKQKAELQQALDSYLSNRSPENIVATANSTRKIVDLVRGGVTVTNGPRPKAALENVVTTPPPQSPAREPECEETLEGCGSQPVKNAGPVANQNELANQPAVVNHSSLSNKAPQESLAKDEKAFRSRKDRRLKGIRISAEKLERYELWCAINKVKFQDAVEKGLDWLTSGQPVNHVLIDEWDDDEQRDLCQSTSSSVIQQIAVFYCQWTKNTISEEDHRALGEVAHLDVNTIKLGILIAICRKASSRQASRKIHSFRYFLGSIREVARSRMGKAVTERALQGAMRSLLKMQSETSDSSKGSQP